MPVIGYLAASSPGDRVRMAEFHRGLNESGYVESQNVTIEYRWAEDQYEHPPALAAATCPIRPSCLAAHF